MEEIKTAPSVIKTDNFLITLLSVLLLISVFIAGFFAYKTQNLVKEITKLRSIPTPIVTSTPTPDPTAGWKTYVNTKYNFSFRYPSKWSIEKDENSEFVLKTDNNEYIVGLVMKQVVDESLVNNNNDWSKVTQIDDKYLLKTEYHTCPKIETGPDCKWSNDKITLNQILSTFKFIEPVACTMEAKVCPDGSAVGRSGAKCEFEACPTPKN